MTRYTFPNYAYQFMENIEKKYIIGCSASASPKLYNHVTSMMPIDRAVSPPLNIYKLTCLQSNCA
jgi:hypothetical protein